MPTEDVLVNPQESIQITTKDRTETFQLQEAQDGHLESVKKLFLELFEDESESLPQFEQAYRDSHNEAIPLSERPCIYVLTDEGQEVVGFRWIQRGNGSLLHNGVRREFGVGYVPYGGISNTYKNKNLQNQGLYTQIIFHTEQLLKAGGTHVMVTECFQPQKNSQGQDTHYTPEYSDTIMRFFQGNGYDYIDAPYPISGLWGTDTPGGETDWKKQIYSRLKVGVKLLQDIDGTPLYVTDGLEKRGIKPDFYRSVYDAVQKMVYRSVFSPETSNQEYNDLVATQTFYRMLADYPTSVPLVSVIGGLHAPILAE